MADIVINRGQQIDISQMNTVPSECYPQVVGSLESKLKELISQTKYLQSQISQLRSTDHPSLLSTNESIKQYIHQLNFKYVYYQQQKRQLQASIADQTETHSILSIQYQEQSAMLEKAKRAVVRESIIKQDAKGIQEATRKCKGQYSLALKKLRFMEKEVEQGKERLRNEETQQQRLSKEIERMGEGIKESIKYEEIAVKEQKDDDVSTCKSLNLRTLTPF